jgi:ADP-ribose pyrophosphatase
VAFERVDSEVVFSGGLISVRRERFRHDDGGEVAREHAVHPGAAVVVAYDGEHVHLVRQPREVVGEEALLELPAGKVDPGETPERTAARELAEEIGKRAGRLEPAASVYASPGFSDEVFHLFFATELVDAPTAGVEEEERITPVAMGLSELDRLIESARDAKTLIGLMLLARRLG